MFLGLLFLLISSPSWTSTDEKIDVSGGLLYPASTVDPQEAFIRTEAVLKHFGVPAERLDQKYLTNMGEHFGLNDLRDRLEIMDPMGAYQKFLQISGSEIQVAQDFGSQEIPDFTFNLNQAISRPSLRDRLEKAAKNPSNKQFSGLKIALDPGHMGGSYWDKITGKFVSDGKNTVSEGVINLQTCLLLKKDLESLGAKVLITHEGLEAIAKTDFYDLDLKPYALQELRLQSLAPWFQNLIATAPVGQALYDAFSNSKSFNALFRDIKRHDYFVKRADLDARVEMMSAFNPDITIYVHHDTVDGAGASPNRFRAFIPGSFQFAELSDRNSRMFLTRHWLDKDAWDLSVQMIRATAKQVKSRMGIPAATSDGEESVKIEDGVFARNLLVPRKMRDTVTAYYEMFFYDRPEEFKALLDTPYSMTIDGKSIPYSKRVRQSADSLREGLKDFVQSLK
jgi:N-acetylmuramoyl-L-alanine amidase